MKKILKIFAIALFTLFVGYNMLYAEESSRKDIEFEGGLSISYYPEWKGQVWTEEQVEEYYDICVIECDEVYNNGSVWPEEVSFQSLNEVIKDEYMSKLTNKTFSYARQYSCAFLEQESGSGLAVFFVKYGFSYKYFFWFYN